jgi:hypothetical protein
VVSDGDFSSPVSPSTSFATYCVTGDKTVGHACVADTFGAWTLTGGSVDVYANNFTSIPAPPTDPTTTQAVDMDGNDPGTITQPLASAALNTTYNGSLEVNGNIADCGPNPRSITISVDGAAATPIAVLPGAAWAPETFTLTTPAAGTTPPVLQIASNDTSTPSDPTADQCGVVLTDLTLTPQTSGTPLASPLVAVPAAGVIALGAAAWYSRRRRHATVTPAA